jgi:hypothetical protein
MKITEQTTLAELAVERARLGIDEMSIHINTKGARTCAVFGNGRGCQVAGKTEAEAIDAAFRKFELAAAGTDGVTRFARLVAINDVDYDAALYNPPAGLITPAMPGGPEDRLWNNPPISDGPECEAKGQCEDIKGDGTCFGCGRWLGDK